MPQKSVIVGLEELRPSPCHETACFLSWSWLGLDNHLPRSRSIGLGLNSASSFLYRPQRDLEVYMFQEPYR